MNSDTEVTQGWADALLTTHTKYSKSGVIGAKILGYNNTIQHAGIRWDDHKLNVSHEGKGAKPNDLRFSRVREVFAVTGACVLIPRCIFFECEGFDLGYGKAYFEDVDFCMKAKEKGYKILYCPLCVIYHRLSSSMKKDTKPGSVSWKRNLERFKLRWKK